MRSSRRPAPGFVEFRREMLMKNERSIQIVKGWLMAT